MNTVGWVSNDGTYLKEEAGTGWFSSKKVRLFPNDRRVRFEAPVHEYVEYSLLDAGIMIRACAIPVQHYGKLDMEKLKAKGEQYYELGKLKWEERGVEDPISIFELAVQASELGKFDEALVYFERVVTLVPTFPKALYGLGNTYYRLGKYEEAFTAMKKAIQIAEDDTNYRDAVTLFAHAALCIGKANEGIEYLKQFLNKYPDDPKYQNDSVIQLLFGISYLTTGSEETAMAHMQKLKELNPGAAYFLTDFVKVLLTSQQAETAMLVLKAAEKMNLATSEFPSLIDACEKKVAEMKEKDSRGQGSEAVT
jgi:tetratricopeptide (TPR) repeat protein